MEFPDIFYRYLPAKRQSASRGTQKDVGKPMGEKG